MNLVRKFQRSLSVLLLVPLLLFLLVVNLVVLHLLVTHHAAGLESVRRSTAAQLDLRLAAEAGRMRQLAVLPVVEALAGAAGRNRASAAQSPETVESIDESWAKRGRDDLLVREVLDNSLSEALRRAQTAQPFITQMLLADGEGIVLAAAKKPRLYDYSGEPWWAVARDATPGQVVSEGLAGRQLLGLSLVLAKPGGRAGAAAVLREEVDLEALAGDLLDGQQVGPQAVMLMSGGGIVGVSPAGDTAAAALVTKLGKPGDRRGWHAGLRYAARPADGGVQWNVPLWVVAVRKEGFMAPSVYWPFGTIVVVSIVIAVGSAIAFRRFMGRTILGPNQELLEAGDWILRTALSRPGVLSEPTSDPAKRANPDATAVQKELQKWLHRLVQDLQDEYATQTYEMQRDLSLARDFQQAYIDRAYPKIPAVHVEGRLRLDFYHRYEPALALGGDFYNILTLAPDCAGVFVADVMGHGTRSALITAIIRTLIDDLAPQGRNARHFLTEMNKLFCGLLKSVPVPLYASCFYFVGDTTARVATYSSAGHPAPFHIRRSVGRIARLEVPMPRGTALGLLPSESYTGGYSRLIDGDVFVFFTDGVYEARNTHGEEFGIARMEQVLQGLMYKSLKEMVDGLMEAISNFVSYEPVSDDICIVAVEVTTKPAR